LRITCLRFFPRIQLYAPNDEQMHRCLERVYSSLSRTTLQTVVERSQGDFRSAVRLLSDRFRSSRRDRTDGMYDATRSHLSGERRAEEWEREAMERDSGPLGPYTMLLFHNHLDFTHSLQQACRQSEALSLAETGFLHSPSAMSLVSTTFHASRPRGSQITLRFPRLASLMKPERSLPYTDAAPAAGRGH
jgi:hypothetical protein